MFSNLTPAAGRYSRLNESADTSFEENPLLGKQSSRHVASSSTSSAHTCQPGPTVVGASACQALDEAADHLSDADVATRNFIESPSRRPPPLAHSLLCSEDFCDPASPPKPGSPISPAVLEQQLADIDRLALQESRQFVLHSPVAAAAQELKRQLVDFRKLDFDLQCGPIVEGEFERDFDSNDVVAGSPAADMKLRVMKARLASASAALSAAISATSRTPSNTGSDRGKRSSPDVPRPPRLVESDIEPPASEQDVLLVI